ncbi:MAG TPA: hypothetical protein VKV40_07200 [Ktedonobacteraceae bacterium]|nr:hypothetical protein [Ktedonobacteraceae bacterium]
MGVERAVTRWYAQRQVILDEIAALQANLISLQNQQAQQTDETAAEAGTRTNAEAIAEIERRLVDARTRLRELGPCPKTMMG